MKPASIRVGSKFRYGGERAIMGISFHSKGDVDIGDMVGPADVPATMQRPAVGQPFYGECISKESDGCIGVRNDMVHIAKAKTAISNGLQNLAADGEGGVQAGGTVPCLVLGSETRDGQLYVAFHLTSGF